MPHRFILSLILASACAAQQLIPSIPPRSKDTDSSNLLFWKAGSDLSANRDFTLTTGDANRTLTLSGDVSLNQNLLTSSSPGFTAVTLTGASSNSNWALLKPNDYGTTYNSAYGSLGTVHGWSFNSKDSANGPTNWTGRNDRNFCHGYNIGSDCNPVNSDEPAYSEKLEVNWLNYGDSNAGSTSYTATSKVHSGGHTTITAASGTPFASGSTILQRCSYVYFKDGTTSRAYKIDGWTSNTVARVAGDASGESGTFQILTIWVERYPEVWWPGAVSPVQWHKTIFDCSTQKVKTDTWSTENTYFYTTSGTLCFGLRNEFGLFYIYQNNRPIYMAKTTSATTPVIAIDSSDRIAIGSAADGMPIKLASSGAVTIDGSSVTIGTGNLVLTSGTITNGDAKLSTTDVTTNDVSTSKHGFAPKAPNDTTKYLRGDATWAAAGTGLASSIGFFIDGGGSVITTGAKTYVRIPYACTITGYEIVAQPSGSIVVDVLKSTGAGFPPTASIAASDKPTLSGAARATGSATGWTTSVSAGDYIRISVDSASTVTSCYLSVNVTRN